MGKLACRYNEAHWGGGGDGGGEAIAAVMCLGKKQACGKHPSPRGGAIIQVE
jgi:hypothetical protein